MSWGPPAYTAPHGAGLAPSPGNKFNHLGCSMLKEREEKDFSVRWKELAWQVGKHVLPPGCVVDKMA